MLRQVLLDFAVLLHLVVADGVVHERNVKGEARVATAVTSNERFLRLPRTVAQQVDLAPELEDELGAVLTSGCDVVASRQLPQGHIVERLVWRESSMNAWEHK